MEWDRPILVALFMAMMLWRFILLVSPTARRMRAARDLAYAAAFEHFKEQHRVHLKAWRAEFGVTKERERE